MKNVEKLEHALRKLIAMTFFAVQLHKVNNEIRKPAPGYHNHHMELCIPSSNRVLVFNREHHILEDMCYAIR